MNKIELRLGIIGCTPGDWHPFSWSAIFNGYDREVMQRECPTPVIPLYLNKEPSENLTIPGAKVTHICCVGDGGFTAEQVSRCALIPNVVENPVELVGEVDAVIIATDVGSEHVDRARPFVEVGLPVFIDKPLTDNEQDLQLFSSWLSEGKPILSSSCMRYAKEFFPFRLSTNNLGEMRFVSITTPKTWESYGIHALEGIYPILGPGFLSIRNVGSEDRNIVHIKHKKGVDIVIAAIGDMYGGLGCLQLCGTAGNAQALFSDSFFAFKAQLSAFVDFIRSGRHPFPFEETIELMKLVIGGIRSRVDNGREVSISEIREKHGTS